METWFEIFISNKQGTRTLETSCKTLEEARKCKEKLLKNIDSESTLHIDKWEDYDNPKKIEEIE